MCFNPQLFRDQRNAREKNIELLKNEILPELNNELGQAKKSRQFKATEKKFKKFITKLISSSIQFNHIFTLHYKILIISI